MLKKWWGFLVFGVLWLVHRLRDSLRESPDPDPKLPPAPEVATRDAELAKSTEERAAALRDAELAYKDAEAAHVKRMQEEAPGQLSDADKLNEYLKETGREARK
jgi:hypothetical protein